MSSESSQKQKLVSKSAENTEKCEITFRRMAIKPKELYDRIVIRILSKYSSCWTSSFFHFSRVKSN